MPSVAIADWGFAEALLAGERRLLELVAAGEPLPVVLDALCAIAETTGSGAHCSILLVGENARFHFGAGRTLPPGFDRGVENMPVVHDVGPCGMAASLKAQVVVADLVADPRWRELAWRAAVMDFGLRSAWSTPILSRSGAVLGTFAMWHEQPGAPIVFISAHADSATRPNLLREGAIECLSKPFSDTALLAAVELALREAGK